MKKHPLTPSKRGGQHKGFTLIETLFAILIFSAALISLIAISSKGISATREVKNETVAFYLAQEGIEVVRNLRDNNFIANANWTDGFVGTPDCETGCYVKYGAGLPPTLDTISGANDTEVGVNSSGLYMDHIPGFSRTITVAKNPSNDPDPTEYQVISNVSWNSKGIKRNVELQTVLKKWR